MWVYVARRLLAIPPLLLAVSFVTYLLLYLAPGDYVDQLKENPAITQETLNQYIRDYGLEGGFFQRYGHWLGKAVTLDFGYSFSNHVPVFSLISERVANTLLLSITAMIAAWMLALPLGVVAAVYQGTLIDKTAGFIAFCGLSIPRVFYALLAVLFAAKTGWFPTGGMRDQVYWDDFTAWERVKDVAHHLVLPVFVIASAEMASHMRQMRAQMLETLGRDFVRTARAKGLGFWTVVWKHAFGNAVNPLVTQFGYSLAALLTGSFLVEVVFSWPGMARLTVDAVFKQDEPLVMAAVIMATVMLSAGNLIADLILAAIDPRIRLE
ncbi:ABC transporter permease [Myxococcota bacterium]|jgi:peptide/nickel transport system permease protein|nr:ABC transporter permease [Myxococcota bacterium]